MNKRIEVFSASCPCCEEAVQLLKGIAGPSDEVVVVDMNDPDGARRAKAIGLARVPAVAVNGQLASCCAGRGVDPDVLREMGVGE